MRIIPDVRPAVLASALFFVAAAPVAGQLPEMRSSLNGVYTEEQAEKGAEVFANICSNCHNASYPLWGPKFMGMWSGQSLWKLYEFLSTRMPYGDGGGLTPEEYRAVTAYVLRRNGYPAGDTPIPETPLEIAFITFDPHPKLESEATAPDGAR